MPSQTLAPRWSSYVSLGTRRNTTRAVWRFSTTGCGGQCVTMTSPSQLPTWCVVSLASWTQSRGYPQQNMAREKVRKPICCLKPEVHFIFWHLTALATMKTVNDIHVPPLSDRLVSPSDTIISSRHWGEWKWWASRPASRPDTRTDVISTPPLCHRSCFHCCKNSDEIHNH